MTVHDIGFGFFPSEGDCGDLEKGTGVRLFSRTSKERTRTNDNMDDDVVD